MSTGKKFKLTHYLPGSVVYSGAMMCQERIRLVADYRETTRTYADFVRRMTDLVGLGVESEVDLLQRSCRVAWEAAEKARLALFRHEANHSCNRPDFWGSAASAGPRTDSAGPVR
jgi:hypothetical protein